MLAGGLACAVANGSLHPLETTKVKLQLQDLHVATRTCPAPTTRGMVRQIVREDGLARGLLLPGLSASLVRSFVSGGGRIGLYPTVRNWVSSGAREPTLRDRMISGTLTGGIGSAASCPLDCVRTRLQADAGRLVNGLYTTGLRRGQPQRYRGMIHALSTILLEEGLLKGLYRGSSVTVARASLLSAAQLASYDTLKQIFKGRFAWEEGPALHLMVGITSGVIAQTVVMPFDTTKSHVMLGSVCENDELCIKNKEICIKNEEFCIKNEELCIKNDEICREATPPWPRVCGSRGLYGSTGGGFRRARRKG